MSKGFDPTASQMWGNPNATESIFCFSCRLFFIISSTSFQIREIVWIQKVRIWKISKTSQPRTQSRISPTLEQQHDEQQPTATTAATAATTTTGWRWRSTSASSEQVAVHATAVVQLLLEDLLQLLQPETAHRQRSYPIPRGDLQSLLKGGQEQVVPPQASGDSSRRTTQACQTGNDWRRRKWREEDRNRHADVVIEESAGHDPCDCDGDGFGERRFGQK